MKLLIIVVIVAVAGLGIWRFMAGRVDYTKPEQVSSAFIAAIKNHNISKAGKYYVPSESEAWVTAATARMNQMQSGTAERFYEDLPDSSTAFTPRPKDPKMPANEMSMINGNTMLDLRQVDGKWYVCRSPL